MKQVLSWGCGIIAVLVVGFLFLMSIVMQVTGASGLNVTSGCSAPAGPQAAPMLASPSAEVSTPSASGASATATAVSQGESTCYPSSVYGAAVVQWARKMADTLYVNPACGTRRGGNSGCNDTFYTSAFPQPVIAYGQAWCQAHGDCSDWSNGNYQCVSFVRGAYSQVYPMTLTNDAFGLWATYQHAPGWQEIPAAATGAVGQRFLPEPGDVMVFRDQALGHVAIVLTVQPPRDGKNGLITFANANSSSAYDQMPLQPNLLVDTREWDPSGEIVQVWGYLRPKPAASSRVVRISQLDRTQYDSAQEYTTWAFSACSTAAMTEVLNAYGFHLRIHDVLQVEAGLHEITPQGGLQEDVGIANTLSHFGLQTTWGEHWTLAQVVGAANNGTPVIVSWPPSRYPGGHLVVVTGGDLTASTLEIADSSAWNRQQISVSQFLQWWAGFAAVAVPTPATGV